MRPRYPAAGTKGGGRRGAGGGGVREEGCLHWTGIRTRFREAGYSTSLGFSHAHRTPCHLDVSTKWSRTLSTACRDGSPKTSRNRGWRKRATPPATWPRGIYYQSLPERDFAVITTGGKLSESGRGSCCRVGRESLVKTTASSVLPRSFLRFLSAQKKKERKEKRAHSHIHKAPSRPPEK